MIHEYSSIHEEDCPLLVVLPPDEVCYRNGSKRSETFRNDVETETFRNVPKRNISNPFRSISFVPPPGAFVSYMVMETSG